MPGEYYFCENNLEMTKRELRSLYLEKRKELSKEEVITASERIFRRFLSNFFVEKNQKIHLFLSIEKFNEVNTLPFIKYLQEKEVRIFVPKMLQGYIISVEILEDTILAKNSWGIMEPISDEDSPDGPVERSLRRRARQPIRRFPPLARPGPHRPSGGECSRGRDHGHLFSVRRSAEPPGTPAESKRHLLFRGRL